MNEIIKWLDKNKKEKKRILKKPKNIYVKFKKVYEIR